MSKEKQRGIDWLDVLWLLFLLGLALVPPLREPHKQLTLLAIGVVQLLEGRLKSQIAIPIMLRCPQ